MKFGSRNMSFRPLYKSRRTGKFRIWPILIFGAFFLFYYFSNLDTVPITGRSQLVAITEEQENALGFQSFQKVLSQSDVVTQGPEVDFVMSVARQLIPVVKEADFDWDFKVIRSDQANAFALPGGKVAVYTGILPITKNRDGLAAVLGHEIAHAVARHGAERMAQQKLTQWATMAVSMSVGEMGIGKQRMVLGALGIGSQFGMLLPFSRKHESEADKMGLVYMSRACFNPEEAAPLWVRMGEQSKGGQAEFMSTHPAPETRVEQFKEWMPEALKIRAENCS